MKKKKATACVVCTKLLEDEDDFPGGDTSKDWCLYCGTKKRIHPYKKLVMGMSHFLIESKGMAPVKAKKFAEEAIKSSIAYKKKRIKKR